MRIIFCSDPINNKKVDIDYESEYNIAIDCGLKVDLINFEELVDNKDSTTSIKKIIKVEIKELAIYRGWMLKPNDYSNLYNALVEKNVFLINSPEEYKFCHYLPYSYPSISNSTPKTTWIMEIDYKKNFNDIYNKLTIFGNSPIIVKDFVKSRKHEWNDACYIFDASNKTEVHRVVTNFLNLQGEDINEGLVFREFLKLEYLTNHSKSSMPLTKEFRYFIKDKKSFACYNYWDEGDYGEVYPDISIFSEIINKVNSNFFTMDVAKQENGDWIIIELGDGQVSGLPDNADILNFYKALI